LPAEVTRLTALLESERAHYRSRPRDAFEVAGPLAEASPSPEFAAWTIVANVLLNLDEAVTKQ